MPRVRASGAAFLLGLLVAILGSSEAAARDLVAPTLHGIVRDTLGRALTEVEVLVLSEAANDAPLVIVRTDDHGRFFVGGLAPGIYRIAAIKHGYLAFLGRFNTLFRESLDLVLRPVPGEAAGTPGTPADSSWILRLPARSLLRETDAADLLRHEDGRRRTADSALAETLEGQLDHLVALGVGLPGGSRETTSGGGAETRMRLGSAIGQRGNVQVSGERESFDRVATAQSVAGAASHEATSVFVEASCATGPDASLAMKASYSHGDVDLSGGLPQQSGRLRHARRSWGYDANWSTQLDPASRLAVKVGYLDTLADLPDVGSSAPSAPASAGRRPFASRAMAAGGSFESLAAERHQVHVNLEASLQDLPLPMSFVEERTIAAGPAQATGWSVRVRAEDQWLLSAPLTFVYGLGYARASDGRRSSVVEPRVGGTWTDGTWRARLVLFYDVFADGAPVARVGLPLAAASRRPPALGYDAEVETPLPFGLSLRAAENYEPVAFDASGAVWDRIDPGFTPLFSAEGSVSARRRTLTLSHEAGGVQTYLQLLRGTAEGTLAQVFPFEVPLQLLDDRRLRYHGGRVGLRVAGSGTDVFAEYRKVEDAAGLESPSERITQEFVEFQVAQDLLRGEPRGAFWRFLLVARTSPQRQTEAEDPANAAGLRTLAALSRRVSAGVSVAF